MPELMVRTRDAFYAAIDDHYRRGYVETDRKDTGETTEVIMVRISDGLDIAIVWEV